MVNRDTQEGERCVRFSGICIDSTCFSPITCQYWDVKVSPPHWMDNTLSLTLGDLRPQSVSLPPSVCWSILECSRQRVKNAMNQYLSGSYCYLKALSTVHIRWLHLTLVQLQCKSMEVFTHNCAASLLFPPRFPCVFEIYILSNNGRKLWVSLHPLEWKSTYRLDGSKTTLRFHWPADRRHLEPGEELNFTMLSQLETQSCEPLLSGVCVCVWRKHHSW